MVKLFTDSTFYLQQSNLFEGINSIDYTGPLDSVTSGLIDAWSVYRRLLAAYTGPLIRVRRSSDNAEQDIDAAATGLLDTAALLSFVGANNGFVSVVYGQSGGQDMEQATAGSQPQIVSSGSLLTDSLSTAAMQGSNKSMAAVFTTSADMPFTVYANASGNVPNATYELLVGWDSAISRWFGKQDNETVYATEGRVSSGAITADNALYAYCYGSPINNDALYINGVDVGTASGGTGNDFSAAGLTWGNRSTGGIPWNGKMKELALYNATHSGGTIVSLSDALAL